jgi:choline dehydrogenase
MRGNPHDNDHWADLGNRGWSYQEMSPYFRKLQHQERSECAHHGSGRMRPLREYAQRWGFTVFEE